MELTPVFAALVPVVIALVGIARASGLPDRFAPLASLLIGIGLSALVGGFGTSIILSGILVGAAASGMYSMTKTTFKGALSNSDDA